MEFWIVSLVGWEGSRSEEDPGIIFVKSIQLKELKLEDLGHSPASFYPNLERELFESLGYKVSCIKGITVNFDASNSMPND